MEWSRSENIDALDNLEILQARYTARAFPVHAHREYVIGVITKGAEVFEHGRRRHVVQRGEIFLLNPYEQHTGRAAGADWQYCVLYPTPEHFNTLAPEAAPLRFASAVRADPRAAQLILALHAMHAAKATSLSMQTVLLQLYAWLAGFSSRETLPPRQVRRVREFLETDLSADVGLKEIAQVVGLSPSAALQAFRRSVGCTPHAYRTAVRLAAAKQMLRAKQPLSDVAAQTGFSDQSHMTRVFRRWTGLTPAHYARA